MGRKRPPGLVVRAGVWHIDKQINGQRVRQSTGTGNLEEAERYLARLMEENRQAVVYGVRPQRSFEQAAAKYVLEYQHKRSLDSDIGRLKSLMPWIGEMPLERIHTGSLQPWINYRRDGGAKTGTINHGLKVVRRILNLAATEWFDEYGMTWLQAAAKIRLLPDHSKQPPYPMSWDEQDILFKELPPHLAEMALFAVNTGCRVNEICNLQWEWEVDVPSLNTKIFIIPGELVKNGDERVVVLNRIALSVVNSVRGKHPTHVFSFRGTPVTRMLNSAWRKARERADYPMFAYMISSIPLVVAYGQLASVLRIDRICLGTVPGESLHTTRPPSCHG